MDVKLHLTKPVSASGAPSVTKPYPPGVTSVTANADESLDVVYTATAAGLTTELNLSWPTANGDSAPGPQTTVMTVSQTGEPDGTQQATIDLIAGVIPKVTKTAASSVAAPNRNFTYSIAASTQGLDPDNPGHGLLKLTDVTFVEKLPEGARYISSDLWPSPVYDEATNTLTMHFDSWAGWAGWAVTVQFDESAVGRTLTNTWTMTGTPLGGNDPISKSATADVTVRDDVPPAYDLEFNKEGSIQVKGEHGWWYLHLTNRSNVDADATIVDSIPKGEDLESIALGSSAAHIGEGSTVQFTYADGTKDTVPLNLSNEGAVTNAPEGKPRVVSVQLNYKDLQAGQRVDAKLIVLNTPEMSEDLAVQNCATATLHGIDRTYCTSTGQSAVPVPNPQLTKHNLTTSPIAPGGQVEWSIALKNSSSDEGKLTTWLPVLYDSIPNELTYDERSLSAVESNATSCPAARDFTETILPDYKGGAGDTPRTAVKWTYNGTSGVTSDACEYTYTTTVKPGSKAKVYTGYGLNPAYEGNRIIGFDREVRLPASTASLRKDAFDANQNGDLSEATALSTADFTVGNSSAAWIQKWVSGDQDKGTWFDSAEKKGLEKQSGTSTPGGSVSYKVHIGNLGNQDLKNLVAYDILPLPDNHGVTSGRYSDTPEGKNTWTPSMTGPIDTSHLPAAVQSALTVTYSAKDDPCRPEMDNTDDHSMSFYCAGQQDGSWMTAGEVTDWSKVRSVRFDFGSHTFQPAEAYDVQWAMKAPTKLADGSPIRGGEPTWNKIAITAKRVSDGTSLLAAEAPWVVDKMYVASPIPEIKFAIGDYTWIDANRNGIQDEGEKPIGGVQVALFSEDGTKIAETMTDKNGYYHFDNLDAGKYYIEFGELIGYVRTSTGAGGDQTKDSNADVKTGRTAVFELGVGRGNTTESVASDRVTAPFIDRTIDAGYYLTVDEIMTPTPTPSATTTTTPTPSTTTPSETTTTPTPAGSSSSSAPVAQPGTYTPPSSASVTGGFLPRTGADAARLLGMACLLTGAGAVAVVLIRRRRA